MKKTKIAQIGTSHYSHGSEIFDCLKQYPDVFEIVGYALPENEREKFPQRSACFDGYREMTVDEILNDPEITAVTIETEEIYLTKYANLAAEHKKHIHMEKPGSPDLEGFERLINTVKKNGTVFSTGYMYRHNPYIKELMRRIESGELGEIISVEAQMNCYHPEPARNWFKVFGGGMMFFLGCHLVDLILQIQGTPQEIIPLSTSSHTDDIDSLDYGMAVFKYKNGVSFAKTSAIEMGGFFRRQLVVTGTKGTAEVRPLEAYRGGGYHVTGYREVFDKSWGADSERQISEKFMRYDDMILAFADMINGNGKTSFRGYDYELELYKTLLKACGYNI